MAYKLDICMPSAISISIFRFFLFFNSFFFFFILVFHLLLVIVAVSASTEAALFDGCDNAYTINPGKSIVQSPYYPNSYPAGTSCRYKFTAPLDYDITVNCTINLDKGANACSTENFYLARDGDVLLRDSEQFCGSGTFIRKSLFRTVVLAYVSGGSYGSFRCELNVQPQPCDCGWSVNTKIVNGVEASVNEYPSMVALRDITTDLPSYCAGSIISHRHVLTAAHCNDVQTNVANIRVLVGHHNLVQGKKFLNILFRKPKQNIFFFLFIQVLRQNMQVFMRLVILLCILNIRLILLIMILLLLLPQLTSNGLRQSALYVCLLTKIRKFLKN